MESAKHAKPVVFDHCLLRIGEGIIRWKGNPEMLRMLVKTFTVPEGHEHAEDIIRGPAVMRWVDEYLDYFA